MLTVNRATSLPSFQSPKLVTHPDHLSLEEFVSCSPLKFTQLFQTIMTTDGIRISAKGVKTLTHKKFDNPMTNYSNDQYLGAGRNGSVRGYWHKGELLAVKSGYHDGNPKRLMGYLNEAINHFIAAKHMPTAVIGIKKVLVNNEKIFFVLERGTDSLNHIATSRFLSLHQITKIAESFGRTLSQLHSIGIAHNDIKTDNILAAELPNGEWALKIIDFGASRQNSVFVDQEKNGVKKLLLELLQHFQNATPSVRQPSSPDYDFYQRLMNSPV